MVQVGILLFLNLKKEKKRYHHKEIQNKTIFLSIIDYLGKQVLEHASTILLRYSVVQVRRPKQNFNPAILSIHQHHDFA